MNARVRSGVPLSLRFAGAALALLALVFTQVSGHAASTAAQTVVDPLAYSKGYLVTGDYVVGGVDVASKDAVGGFVTGTIPMSGVPANADILAAFLYWETIAADASQAGGVKFRGLPVQAVKASSMPLTGQNAACWASGSNLTMTMFRADVLRLLPEQLDAGRLATAKRLVNDADLSAAGLGPNTVTLPQLNGNLVPESAGASLVIVYRDPAQPLRKISLYDGIYIQPQGDSMLQHLRGFYKSAAGASARMTEIGRAHV